MESMLFSSNDRQFDMLINCKCDEAMMLRMQAHDEYDMKMLDRELNQRNIEFIANHMSRFELNLKSNDQLKTKMRKIDKARKRNTAIKQSRKLNNQSSTFCLTCGNYVSEGVPQVLEKESVEYFCAFNNSHDEDDFNNLIGRQ